MERNVEFGVFRSSLMYNLTKKIIRNNLINAFGSRTKRQIVAFESDDWGSIRMPSIVILNQLIAKKIDFDFDLGFDTIDTIESPSDLEHLYEILGSVRDKNNNAAVLTANCVVANPDFKKIKDSNYSEYHYELITETMARYYPQSNPLMLWKQGIDHGVFYPQFHGREHLNVQLWLNLLHNDLCGSREAFCRTVFSQLMRIPNDSREHVLSAYDYRDESEQRFIKNSINEGMRLFENLVGYRSTSAIAPCYVWDDFIEQCYLDEGIKYIQGGFFQHYSTYQKKQTNKKGKYRFCGEKNKLGQYALVRNCHFEPSIYLNKDSVDECLNQIKIAFRWGKPAIISTHRLNFIGALNEKNRADNLKKLQTLLNQIVRQWSEVEFMTSDNVGNLLKEGYEGLS